MKMRLDKVLASNGFGSRKQIKKMLHKKGCKVNDINIFDSSVKIEPETDKIEIGGKPIVFKAHVYLMLNKPAGCVTSTKDPVNKTVMELLCEPFSVMELFPVGRLDIDTEGLLIITNDGVLTHKITSPKSGILKRYHVRLEKPLTAEQIEEYRLKCNTGLRLENGYICSPASFQPANQDKECSDFIIGITEGKYHQVKKMCKALGNTVIYLKRISIGQLTLDPLLKTGCFKELSAEETALLFK